MEKRFNETYPDGTDMWELTTDADHILHRIDSDNYSDIRRISVPLGDIASWEELPLTALPPYTEAQYDAAVSALIRARYSLDAELATLRQRDTKPSEFAAYHAFAEQCKAQAREQLAAEAAAPDAGEAATPAN